MCRFLAQLAMKKPTPASMHVPSLHRIKVAAYVWTQAALALVSMDTVPRNSGARALRRKATHVPASACSSAASFASSGWCGSAIAASSSTRCAAAGWPRLRAIRALKMGTPCASVLQLPATLSSLEMQCSASPSWPSVAKRTPRPSQHCTRCEALTTKGYDHKTPSQHCKPAAKPTLHAM